MFGELIAPHDFTPVDPIRRASIPSVQAVETAAQPTETENVPAEEN